MHTIAGVKDIESIVNGAQDIAILLIGRNVIDIVVAVLLTSNCVLLVLFR